MAESDYTVTITRKAAREAGLKRYFTGGPCKHGHIAERLEINGSCCECARLKRLTNYHANIEEERRKQKIRRDSDPNNAAKKWARKARREPGYAERSMSWHAANLAKQQARERGENQYFTGLPCQNGHIANRFTGDGKCVECNRLACLARRPPADPKNPSALKFRRSRAEICEAASRRAAERAEKVEPWHEARRERQAALKSGAKTYRGTRCPHGHSGLRYTSGGGCVECAASYSSSDSKKQYDYTYFRRNRDRILERSRQYALKNADKIRAYAGRWNAANPSRRKSIIKSYKARRRQQERGGDSTATIHAWEKAAPKVCHWCGVKCRRLYQVDHYVPLAKGGRHVVSNLVIACRKCNLRKSARDPYVFAAMMGRLF